MGGAYLNDPASGRRTVGFDEFRKSYSEIAFSFELGSQFAKRGGRPSALGGLIGRLSRSRIALVFVVLAGLALVIPNLAAAALQRVFIDGILVEGHLTWLRPLLFAVAATALMRLAAAGLQQVYLGRLEVRLTLAESLGFLRHALQLPVGFFQRRFTGDIVGAGVADGARGWPGIGRAGNDGRQLAHAGRLRGPDAPLRHLVDRHRRGDQRLQPVGAAGGPSIPRRSEPVHRADPRPSAGRSHVGDSDHREHQGDRFRVGPARAVDRRAGPDDQRRAGTGRL